MTYRADPARYETMQYRHSGRSGLQLPVVSLGLWQNFGGTRDHDTAFEILGYAFDHGVTHFDLANNYGPPPGSAEELFGTVLAREFRPYRDEMIISSKAGYLHVARPLWRVRLPQISDRQPRPVAQAHGARLCRYLLFAPLSTPTRRSRKPWARWPSAVQQGKALYVGISSYPEKETREAHRIFKEMGVACTIHQPSYSMLNRWIEDDGTIDACGDLGIGIIAFSPLAQGVLSGKYNSGGKQGTRASEKNSSLRQSHIEPNVLEAVEKVGRNRQSAWAVHGAAGARLGFAAQGDDLGADRRAHPRPAQGQSRRAR